LQLFSEKNDVTT